MLQFAEKVSKDKSVSVYKSIINRDPTVITAIAATLVNLVKKKYELWRIVKKWGYTPIETDKLAVRSDGVIFILGCGPTINELTCKQKTIIERSVSVGINMFAISDITPFCYAIEAFLTRDHFELFVKFLKSKKSLNKKIRILSHVNMLKNEKRRLDMLRELVESIGIYDEVQIGVWDSSKLYKTYRVLLSRLLLSFMNLGLVYGKRGSVSRLSFMAYAAGFRDIVYAGVDLSNAKYFWDDSPGSLSKFGIKKLNQGQTGTVHSTENDQFGIPVSEVLKGLSAFGQKRGIRLWTTSANSKLAEFLPIYHWNQE